jgi:hypothetical protein
MVKSAANARPVCHTENHVSACISCPCLDLDELKGRLGPLDIPERATLLALKREGVKTRNSMNIESGK